MKSWIAQFPPVKTGQIRFGNPAFRDWHNQLSSRALDIVRAVLTSHKTYPSRGEYSDDIVIKSHQQGEKAALGTLEVESGGKEEDSDVVGELCSYFLSSFGHPVRLDYGTGHESSFQVFLYALCKLGCFGSTSEEPPTALRLKTTTISVWTSYLLLTRQLQTDYMLEPAGSHGVWGLDDYHCLPFYFGACQLQGSNAYQTQ